MIEVSNTTLMRDTITSIYVVGSRRTSSRFAMDTLGSTIRTLERKYNFLRYVTIYDTEDTAEGIKIFVSPSLNNVNRAELGRAIESIIRVFYNDLSDEAGLYFITEFKEHVSEAVIQAIRECGVDLDQIQLEQHHIYRMRKRKERVKKSVKEKGEKKENLLGYSWDDVAKWKHDPGSKFCTLYDKNGNVLDRLNLDRIIENYVEELSGTSTVEPKELAKKTRIHEKEQKLLKLMFERDMDAETAMREVGLSREELNEIINKLSEMEMLQYVSYNTVELTDAGISYISSEKGKKIIR